ncbi:MAG: ribbon-helix-helix protein, CopG family [Acidobacteria bacterium]|nr:ribbon-helix-helix protein, CopG family [Acidobacteriota bacterium]
MARVKVTFTLDESSVEMLERAAERVGKPKSQVVREAIRDYHDRAGRLSEKERRHMLETFDAITERIPPRSARAVDKELEQIRTARRSGGRGSGEPRSR